MRTEANRGKWAVAPGDTLDVVIQSTGEKLGENLPPADAKMICRQWNAQQKTSEKWATCEPAGWKPKRKPGPISEARTVDHGQQLVDAIQTSFEKVDPTLDEIFAQTLEIREAGTPMEAMRRSVGEAGLVADRLFRWWQRSAPKLRLQ